MSTQPDQNEEIKRQLERNLKPRIEANRMAAFLALAMAANIALGVTIMGMMPLKERIPYFVVSNKETGQVAVDKTAAMRFVADDANRRYFAMKFVKELLSIDPYLTQREYMPSARATVVGKAKGQLNNFLDTDKPLIRLLDNPALSRTVDVLRVTLVPGSENVMSIPVVLTTRTGATGESRVKKVLTMHYVTGQFRDGASEAEIARNPIGFYVTQFTIDEEL